MTQENLLQIDDPDMWDCRIDTYDMPSILNLLAYHHTDTNARFTIRFASIKYLCGPPQWRGVNLTVAPKEQCLDIMESLPQYKDLQSKTILKTYRLYHLGSVGQHKSEFQVIAAFSVEIERDGSSEFIDTSDAYE